MKRDAAPPFDAPFARHVEAIKRNRKCVSEGGHGPEQAARILFQGFPQLRSESNVQAGVDRSSRNFALGSAALAHRHIGVGKDAGHDAARAYQ